MGERAKINAATRARWEGIWSRLNTKNEQQKATIDRLLAEHQTYEGALREIATMEPEGPALSARVALASVQAMREVSSGKGDAPQE